MLPIYYKAKRRSRELRCENRPVHMEQGWEMPCSCVFVSNIRQLLVETPVTIVWEPLLHQYVFAFQTRTGEEQGNLSQRLQPSEMNTPRLSPVSLLG